ncbi:eukaryotic translation initiation factor 3 subunit I [Salpingoeca rosetta]|uniref:Eukaryotic translation initiation factor 3 subunit I n=1 Tax=Salpingoeca rosetta (strain ATCC 50818 / BSB-021) TaxID=946362 RepID=F2U780_SALR5|nr:eukaryotic translation initiation factor 3 subunit I [Salpingoeca rosetta]EGD83297.1 eukaryotic translation initiation factor 3 subunit I [Salpingoeca rosetta]|eukprot:XP_004994801.1 eukaryotic translation initiation factor 3 subunit I [Salpingoeca rosetta]
MRPIALNGHDRALTKVRYNREGDLLFSVAKDKVPCVWYSHNGERIGTYEGHEGTVWSCDVDYLSEHLVTASADNTLRVWDVQTGKSLAMIETNTAVRSCCFSLDGRSIMYSTDHAMGYPCYHRIVDLQQLKQEGGKAKPRYETEIKVKEKRITSLLWGPDSCFTAHANGDIVSWDLETKKPKAFQSAHKGIIMDLQFKSDFMFMISASKDHTAKVFDCDTMDIVKTFETERPVNAAAISPTRDHVILGGGQEARDVTTTHGAAGKFDARLHHLVLEEEIGRIKGHFGPINTLAFHPTGKGYASGGEDGFVRVHEFDDIYFDFEFEY